MAVQKGKLWSIIVKHLSYVMFNRTAETYSVLSLSFRTWSHHEWYLWDEFLGVSVDAAAVWLVSTYRTFTFMLAIPLYAYNHVNKYNFHQTSPLIIFLNTACCDQKLNIFRFVNKNTALCLLDTPLQNDCNTYLHHLWDLAEVVYTFLSCF